MLVTTPPSGRTGGTRWPTKHAAILRAATEIFLREGYARTSVDAIATAAGVGKQTVYGHFGNKQKLFFAAVEEANNASGLGPKALATLIADSGDPAADLRAAGVRIVRALLDPVHAALHRLTIAEAAHHPELQRTWRDEPNQSSAVAVIVDYLTECDRRGVLSVPDPALSARQFTMLLAAEAQVRSLRGLERVPDKDVQAIARTTADLIVRAHQP